MRRNTQAKAAGPAFADLRDRRNQSRRNGRADRQREPRADAIPVGLISPISQAEQRGAEDLACVSPRIVAMILQNARRRTHALWTAALRTVT